MKVSVGPEGVTNGVEVVEPRTPSTPSLTRGQAMDVLFAALEDDEVIRRAIRYTAVRALEHANEMLSHGSVANRVTVIRSLMPALVRTLDRKETDDELSKLKTDLHDLMAEMREGVKGLTPLPEDLTDIPEDTPRA